MPNDSTEFENKPSSNKDMWLFLIVLDVIFLCVFGFFLYKHIAGQLFNPIPVPTAVSTATPDALPVIDAEEVVAIEEPIVEEVVAAEPVKETVSEIAAVQEPASQPVPVQQETKQSIVVVPTTGKYRRVTFRWFDPADTVSIVSGFTNRKPQALKKVGDHWETTLSIAPGTYKFLYIVNGKNALDPYALQKDGRSVLEVK